MSEFYAVRDKYGYTLTLDIGDREELSMERDENSYLAMSFNRAAVERMIEIMQRWLEVSE